MTKSLAMGACVFTAAVAVAVAGQALESGPQAGKNIPGAFHPLNVTGGQAGKKHCLV
jgi:hypothetical protein